MKNFYCIFGQKREELNVLVNLTYQKISLLFLELQQLEFSWFIEVDHVLTQDSRKIVHLWLIVEPKFIFGWEETLLQNPKNWATDWRKYISFSLSGKKTFLN